MARVDISEMDLGKLIELGNRVTGHLVGVHVGMLMYIGDRLGLFDALAERGPLSSSDLAAACALNERYVREWANALVAAGYVEVDDDEQFRMTKEAIFLLGDEDSPGFAAGPFQLAFGLTQNVPRLLEHFRRGGGIGYAEIGDDVAIGVERMWAPCHEQFLAGWLEKIPGLVARLGAGATIADVGCGRGRSSVALATLFPGATVVGIDSDAASIAAARQLALSRGVAGNVEFRCMAADDIDDRHVYDFAYLFHTVHDMPDPVRPLAAIHDALKPDGLLLCVESSASSDPMANRGSYGELFSTISPLFNLPVAMASSDVGSGTIVTEKTLEALADKAGFSSYETLAIDFPPPSLLHRFHLLLP